jgi:predicted small integral membrane protein
MADFLVSSLIAFVGVAALVAAVAITLVGGILMIIARKGDRPIELEPRRFAWCAITLGVLMGGKALDVVASVSL